MLSQFYTQARKFAGNAVRRAAVIAHQIRFNGPRVGDFVFANTTVCGVPMRLITHRNDKIISEWIRNGKSYSKLALAEYQTVADYARNANTIVDVGSNIGIVSILISRAAPNAQVFSFEPDPINFAISQINFEMNGCHNVTAINAAVADYTGPIFLHRAQKNWGDHRTYAPNESGEEFTSQARRILAADPTTFFSAVGTQPGLRDIDLIKIYTQGSDIKILKAFQHLLRSGSKVVLEFSPSHLLASGTTEENVRDILGAADRLQAIGPKPDARGDWRPRDVTLEELISYYRSGTSGFDAVGYCCVLADWQ